MLAWLFCRFANLSAPYLGGEAAPSTTTQQGDFEFAATGEAADPWSSDALLDAVPLDGTAVLANKPGLTEPPKGGSERLQKLGSGMHHRERSGGEAGRPIYGVIVRAKQCKGRGFDKQVLQAERWVTPQAATSLWDLILTHPVAKKPFD